MSYFFGRRQQPEVQAEEATSLAMDTSNNAMGEQSDQPAAEGPAQAGPQAQTGSPTQAESPMIAGLSDQPRPSHPTADPADDVGPQEQPSQTQSQALAGSFLPTHAVCTNACSNVPWTFSAVLQATVVVSPRKQLQICSVPAHAV